MIPLVGLPGAWVANENQIDRVFEDSIPVKHAIMSSNRFEKVHTTFSVDSLTFLGLVRTTTTYRGFIPVRPPQVLGVLRCREPESNWRHHNFQSCALPTELSRLVDRDFTRMLAACQEKRILC